MNPSLILYDLLSPFAAFFGHGIEGIFFLLKKKNKGACLLDHASVLYIYIYTDRSTYRLDSHLLSL